MVNPPPLQGLKVLEFAGLAPGPFAGMLLADAGAQVLRIDRAIPNKTHQPQTPAPAGEDNLSRHKASIAVDLKSPHGISLVKHLVRQADVLIDPFRPGVLEKLGLGPDVLMTAEENPRLIYARMTGFRRDGKYAKMAGHDINYLAVSGVLSMLGRAHQKPHAPINILGDFAGGGATLFQGILLALHARTHNGGKGQVVEANMVDGANYLASYPRLGRKTPMGHLPRGQNLLDGGCPFYDTYETKDGKYMSVGALEPQFFSVLIQGLGPRVQALASEKEWNQTRYDRDTWPEMKDAFEKTFKEKTRREWEEVFDGTDACCLPVLGYDELEKNRVGNGNGIGDGDVEGDQRPLVTLRDSPLLAVDGNANGRNDKLDDDDDDEEGVIRGQGPGVEGNGYVARPLGLGEGGVEALEKWFGLSREKGDVIVHNGGLGLGLGLGSSKAKL